MPNLYRYIPFLIAPFAIPGIAAGSRLSAIIVAALFIGYDLFRHRHSAMDWNWLDDTPFWLAIGSFFIVFFQIEHVWAAQQLIPSMVFGLLAVWYLRTHPGDSLTGLTIVTSVTWLILIAHNLVPTMMPNDVFHASIDSLIPHDQISANLHLQKTIITPTFETAAIVTVSAITATTALLFYLLFSPALRKNAVLHAIAALFLIAWFFLSVVWLGECGFQIFAVFVWFHILLYWLPNRTHFNSELLSWLCIAVLITLGSLGYLPFVSIWLSKTLPWIPPLPTAASIQGGVTFVPFWNQTHPIQLGDIIFLAAVGWMFLSRWTLLHHEEPMYSVFGALAVAILLFLPLRPIEWLAHPFLWIAVGHLMSRPGHDESPSWLPSLKLSPLAYGSTMSVVLSVFLILSLSGYWKQSKAEAISEALLQPSSHQKKLELARIAYRDLEYRSDLVAAYVTLAVHQHIAYGQPMQDEKALEYELAIEGCLQDGYIPVYAMKRLSDWYLLHGDSRRSLALLADASAQVPNQTSVKELYAERLFDLGNYEQAVDAYLECLRTQPTVSRYRAKIALAYKSLGKTQEYEQAMRSLHLLHPAEE